MTVSLSLYVCELFCHRGHISISALLSRRQPHDKRANRKVFRTESKRRLPRKRLPVSTVCFEHVHINTKPDQMKGFCAPLAPMSFYLLKTFWELPQWQPSSSSTVAFVLKWRKKFKKNQLLIKKLFPWLKSIQEQIQHWILELHLVIIWLHRGIFEMINVIRGVLRKERQPNDV